MTKYLPQANRIDAATAVRVADYFQSLQPGGHFFLMEEVGVIHEEGPYEEMYQKALYHLTNLGRHVHYRDRNHNTVRFVIRGRPDQDGFRQIRAVTDVSSVQI